MRTLPQINLAPDKQAPRRLYLYQATADATWNGTLSQWEVTAKKTDLDGTLGMEYTLPVMGPSGASPAPVLSGDDCVLVITGDGVAALVPYRRDEALTLSDDDPLAPLGSSAAEGTGGEASRDDHQHPSSKWEQIQDATSDVEVISDTTNTDDIEIGTPSVQWKVIKLNGRTIYIDTTDSGVIYIEGDGGVYVRHSATGNFVRVHPSGIVLELDTVGSNYMHMRNLPTLPGGETKQGNLCITNNDIVYIE